MSQPAELGPQASPRLRGDLERMFWAVVLVIATSLVIYLPNTIPTWYYGQLFEQQASPIFFFREIAWGLVVLALGITLLRNQREIRLPVELFLYLGLAGVLICIAFLMFINTGYPLEIGIYGLRFLQFLPVGIACWLSGRHLGDLHLNRLAWLLRGYVAIQAAVGIHQALTMPPVYGATVFGARSFGTMPLPHHFGMTLSLVAFVFAFTYERGNKPWFWLTVALTLLSGSRQGLLQAGLAVVTLFWIRHENPWIKRLLLVTMPIIALAGVWIVSSPEFSGRHVEVAKDARFDIWLGEISRNMVSATTLLFGWGLGLGATVTIAVFKFDTWPGIFMCDGFIMYLLSSFGLLGVVLYLATLARLWSVGNPVAMPWILAVVFAVNVAFMSWDLFPINVFSAILLGWGAGDRWWRPPGALRG